MQVLGRHAFSRMGTLKLAGWLAETEQKYRIVLYVADTAVSAPWTQTCIRQVSLSFGDGEKGTSTDRFHFCRPTASSSSPMEVAIPDSASTRSCSWG
jgi:hypothetical protein